MSGISTSTGGGLRTAAIPSRHFPVKSAFLMCEFIHRPRGYLHFDPPLNSEAAEQLATSPRLVATHSFYPFIFSVQITKKIARNEDGGVIRRPPKQRVIAYAAHGDSHIFSHYSDKLSEPYEAILREAGCSTMTSGRGLIMQRSASVSVSISSVDSSSEYHFE
jgi:hypothetical protein